MNYNRDDSKEKWTIMMYMRDFDLMVTYAWGKPIDFEDAKNMCGQEDFGL